MAAVGVLVPVKAFADAKVRLAPALNPHERATLARTMAAGVVAAAGDLPVWVVCDDEAVADWARTNGAEVLWMPGRGLNRAVTEGVSALGRHGMERVVVCHADLPRAVRLDHLCPEGPDAPSTVIMVPDRHRDGTNVLSLPTGTGFRFSYGPGSFPRHDTEARRHGLVVVTLDDPDLAWDVDLPADLGTGGPPT